MFQWPFLLSSAGRFNMYKVLSLRIINFDNDLRSSLLKSLTAFAYIKWSKKHQNIEKKKQKDQKLKTF